MSLSRANSLPGTYNSRDDAVSMHFSAGGLWTADSAKEFYVRGHDANSADQRSADFA